MRETDAEKPPEALEREAKERRSTVLGTVVAFGGVAVVVSPVMFTDDLKMIPAVAGLVLVALGGVLIEPATFRPILERVIDAVKSMNPFGKKDL